jgi:hypothetical protein
MAIPKLDRVCDTKASDSQAILQLFDDKCFKIVEKAKADSVFCLDDFAFPVDGKSCIHLEGEMNGGELMLFDNQILTVGSPTLDLQSGAIYVRGIMIKIKYPENNSNGEEIDIIDKNVEIWIEDAETLNYKKHSMYNLFAMFTNPKSNDPRHLINRIKIVNPNPLYSVSITALMVYGKVK